LDTPWTGRAWIANPITAIFFRFGEEHGDDFDDEIGKWRQYAAFQVTFGLNEGRGAVRLSRPFFVGGRKGKGAMNMETKTAIAVKNSSEVLSAMAETPVLIEPSEWLVRLLLRDGHKCHLCELPLPLWVPKCDGPSLLIASRLNIGPRPFESQSGCKKHKKRGPQGESNLRLAHSYCNSLRGLLDITDELKTRIRSTLLRKTEAIGGLKLFKRFEREYSNWRVRQGTSTQTKRDKNPEPPRSNQDIGRASIAKDAVERSVSPKRLRMPIPWHGGPVPDRDWDVIEEKKAEGQRTETPVVIQRDGGSIPGWWHGGE
jgi:hypothetical protein